MLERRDYKNVWNELAQTEEQAMMYVAATTDEETFSRTAAATRRSLEQTVKIRMEDDVLEIGCGVGRVGAQLAPAVSAVDRL